MICAIVLYGRNIQGLTIPRAGFSGMKALNAVEEFWTRASAFTFLPSEMIVCNGSLAVYCLNLSPQLDFFVMEICSSNHNPWDALLFLKRAEAIVVSVCKGDALNKTAAAAYLALEKLVSGWREVVRTTAPKVAPGLLDDSPIDASTRTQQKAEAQSAVKRRDQFKSIDISVSSLNVSKSSLSHADSHFSPASPFVSKPRERTVVDDSISGKVAASPVVVPPTKAASASTLLTSTKPPSDDLTAIDFGGLATNNDNKSNEAPATFFDSSPFSFDAPASAPAPLASSQPQQPPASSDMFTMDFSSSDGLNHDLDQQHTAAPSSSLFKPDTSMDFFDQPSSSTGFGDKGFDSSFASNAEAPVVAAPEKEKIGVIAQITEAIVATLKMNEPPKFHIIGDVAFQLEHPDAIGGSEEIVVAKFSLTHTDRMEKVSHHPSAVKALDHGNFQMCLSVNALKVMKPQLKYKMMDNTGHLPVTLNVSLEESPDKSKLSVDYKVAAGVSIEELSVLVSLPYPASNVQMKPSGGWNPDKKQMLWKVGNSASGTLMARFKGGEASAPITVKATLKGTNWLPSQVDLVANDGQAEGSELAGAIQHVQKHFHTTDYVLNCS